VTITSVGGHLTTLDSTTVTVNFGGADQAKTFTIQEALLTGTIRQHDSVPPANPTVLSNYRVDVYIGAGTSGPADFNDLTNASGVYSLFVPPRASPNVYTFDFDIRTDNNHTSAAPQVSAPLGSTVTTDFTFEKFASETASVGSTAAPPAGTTYSYTIAIDSGTVQTTTSRTFSNLDPGTHTIHYTRTATKSAGSPTTTTITTLTQDVTVDLDPNEADTDHFDFP